LNLELDDLPMHALHAFGTASAAARGGNAAPMVPLMALLQAMEQAETTLHIAPLVLEAQAVGGTLNGSITPDARSPLQARASGELVVRGLEAVQRELAGQGGQGASSPAGVVAMLTALGQQGTGSDGQPVRTYRIELTSAGQLMLNGTDMTALLGGGARAPARAPAGQAPALPAPPAAAPAPQPRGK
jgi:hypothetical protein